jgi:hypothetical protein
MKYNAQLIQQQTLVKKTGAYKIGADQMLHQKPRCR